MKPTSVNSFIDTNILIYLLSLDSKKKDIARTFLSNHNLISTQVVNEYCNICLKKFNLSTSDTQETLISITQRVQVCNIDLDTIFLALKIKHKYKYQYYDSLIIASAIENKCSILYSEDLQHNQIVDNKLKILNPFVAV